MSEYKRNRRPCYIPEELSNIQPQLEKLILNELSNREKLVSCVIEKIERSESLDSLALNVQRFSLTYSFVLNEIVRKIFRTLPQTKFRSRDAIAFFVFEMAERFFTPFLERALNLARSLGRKFGAESISITIGTPFTISVTITLKISA